MKKIGISMMIILVFIILFINLKALEEPTSKKMVIPQTLYSQTTEEKSLEVRVFLNKSHVITDPNAIHSIYLANEENTNRIKIETFNITKGTEKRYLKERYIAYIYELELPLLQMDLKMNHCIMEITLKNDDLHKISIGSLSILSYETTDSINITNQFGKIGDNPYALEQITLDYYSETPVRVTEVFYKTDQFVKVDCRYDELTKKGQILITLPNIAMKFNKTALRLVFERNDVTHYQTIHTFKYFDSISENLDDMNLKIYVLN
ncbi:MAG: hypothetical protein RBQ91_00955 [Acholeplasma sp.]|nr:hypothetical protein [Acholeplasma sp.]